jgi:hypothetical protein
LAAVLAAAFLLPASASATIYSGTVQDESGDGPDPTRDLKSSTASYDNAQGSISFEVRLQAEPASDLQVTTALGRRSTDGTCGTPLLLLGAFLPDGSTIWLIERDGTSPAEEQGDADRTVSGSLVKLRAKDPRLKGFRPNCAETILSDPDQPDTVYDSVNSFDVKPPPPKPKLKASVSRVGSLKRGAAKAVKVRIKNTGKAAAKKVVVRAAVKGTATLTPRVRKLGTIGPGKSRTARFRVRVKSRGKGKVTISARATGRKVKARAATSFHVRVPQPPPPPSSPGLAGKIFWGFENYQWDRSPDVTFLHFTNRSYVRWGVPKGGLKNCGRVTAKLKDGEMQPGCLRYSYNARTGQVRIGKVRGTYRKGKLKLKMDSDVWETDGESWELGLTAKPGTRFKTKLINRGYYGACGVTPYCTTWAEYLQLTRDGRFGRQDSSITTGGTPGVSFIAISKLGPNQRGRYRVLSGGRIRFNYASGKKATETLIVQTNKRGRPDPVHEGLLLNDTWFYREDD